MMREDQELDAFFNAYFPKHEQRPVYDIMHDVWHEKNSHHWLVPGVLPVLTAVAVGSSKKICWMVTKVTQTLVLRYLAKHRALKEPKMRVPTFLWLLTCLWRQNIRGLQLRWLLTSILWPTSEATLFHRERLAKHGNQDLRLRLALRRTLDADVAVIEAFQAHLRFMRFENVVNLMMPYLSCQDRRRLVAAFLERRSNTLQHKLPYSGHSQDQDSPCPGTSAGEKKDELMSKVKLINPFPGRHEHHHRCRRVSLAINLNLQSEEEWPSLTVLKRSSILV